MKVHRCTKCKQRGGYLVFRKTKKNVQRKYPYVGHYDSKKKSKRRWCSLNEEQLNTIEFDETWYQIDYWKLIEKAQSEYQKHGQNQVTEDALVKASKLLEQHGFLKSSVSDRLFHNFTHLFVTEKFIEDILPDKFNDKPKTTNSKS